MDISSHAALKTRPLHPAFGVEVIGIDLNTVTQDHLYPEIRQFFETHSVILFRGQQFDDRQHLRFGALFGEREDRRKPDERTGSAVSKLSNKGKNRKIADENDHKVLNLKANQLWHTDSTFLPVPALANILAAHTVPSSGGETQFVSTRAAFKELSPQIQDKCRNAIVTHRYTHSRAKISKNLANDELFTMWPDQHWRAVWTNPVTGQEALYLASHACAIDGMPGEEAEEFVCGLIEFATRPEFVYSHTWSPGDVIMWDERATLHRGQPWPYDQERTMASICISAGQTDGLDSVRAR